MMLPPTQTLKYQMKIYMIKGFLGKDKIAFRVIPICDELVIIHIASII